MRLDTFCQTKNHMKLTKEERIKAIKASLKALKGDVSKITKADIIAQCSDDMNWLLRELAKAVKVSA